MLPEFPQFKKLELEDKGDIEAFTKKFPPYSDYSFVSLWSWDTRGKARVSVLNGNLVVQFTDYVTGEPFLSFLGTNKPEETMSKILDFIKHDDSRSFLKLVPEHSVADYSGGNFFIREDRDNFDYIYSIDKLRTYKGNTHERIRNMKNRFMRANHNVEVINLDLRKAVDREVVVKLNQQWEMNKEYPVENEEEAMTRLLFPTNDFDLFSVGVLINKVPAAFSINEILCDGYAMSHFAKADIQFEGIYAYLMFLTAEALAAQSCQFLNYEQDLGVPGLRKAKTLFYPEYFLKKYLIESK